MNRTLDAIPTTAITATPERMSLLILLVVLVPDFAVAFLFDLMRRLPSLLTQLRAIPKSTRFLFSPSFRTRVCLADRGHTGLRPRTRRRCKCNNKTQADEKRHREQNRDSFHGSALRITHRK